MKCPHCQSPKAYLRRVDRWKAILLACFFLRPMKCHQCFHKFVTLVIFARGKTAYRPILSAVPHEQWDETSFKLPERGEVLRRHEPPRRGEAA